jgi:hypothetical protein
MIEKLDVICDPVGVPGLHEDIPGADPIREPAALFNARQDIADKQAGLIEATWADLARKHLPLLRTTHVVWPIHKMALRQAVRTLVYQQTGALAEIEDRRWLDSYTGELMDDEQEIDEEDEEQARRKNRQALPVSAWTQYLYDRKPYATEELNAQFIAANREFVGSEDEDCLPEDDRGYLPEGLLPEYTSQVGDLVAEMRAEVQALRRRIDEEIEWARQHTSKHGFPYQIPSIRHRVQSSREAEVFLATLQWLAPRYEPEDIATLFARFQHGFCFDIEHGLWIICSNGLTVDEVLEELDVEEDGRPGIVLEEPPQTEINEIADRLLQEYLDTLELDGSVVRSRYWVEGYIQAVIAGAPLYQDSSGRKTASDLAWEYWRSQTSAAGYEAYLAAKHAGADRKAAGRAFYQAARAAGDIASRQAKEITGILPHGLRIRHNDGERVVTYRVARLIAENEGFRLPQSKRADLVRILTTKGWGSELLPLL